MELNDGYKYFVALRVLAPNKDDTKLVPHPDAGVNVGGDFFRTPCR